MTNPQRRYQPDSYSSGGYYQSNTRNDYQSQGSRAYDCCSRPSPQSHQPSKLRRQDDSRFPYGRPAMNAPQTYRTAPTYGTSTFGTYILPLEAQGKYRTMDPTKCRCKCCPHPSSISHSQDERRYPETPYLKPASKTNTRVSAPFNQRSSSSNSLPRSSRSRRNPQGRYVIDVQDKSDSSLRHEYGPSYPISLDPCASSASIAAFLVPDKRRAKVVVHWDDGKTETLDDGIPMKELIRYAEYLEVKEKKTVHWA
ncbi:hypothetical protein FZEAL_9474 [Fusarium zealandicum]|uniref:Uncharacterized protein n=1 Tax=Fusarium zealandicum TaxID=1053134 RepID=A0A8H4XG22_9HYPO|nr:hypothetical protein FZEAL_9474 [Fusarium zealandicum]